MKKALISFVLFCVLITNSAFASVLGSNRIYLYEYEIADGLTLFENRFLSDQDGVGMQTEHYFEYIPNEFVKPVVTLGEYVYGRKDINEVYSYLKDSGINAVAGINGDFFSLQTGIPIGHVVIDKKIITDDGSVMPAIGFYEDGTSFIDDYQLSITLKTENTQINLPYFNKYLQKWNYYLFDNNYYSEVTPLCKASYVTFEIEEGAPVLDGVIKARVISIEKDTETKKELSENHLVLAVSDEASQELKLGLELFSEDDKVEFSFSANNEKWNDAIYILASSAGQILKNGEQTGDMSGVAAPRTAVGVTADNKAVFYTIDGRQDGHSYGVRLPTLVERMKELGCVDVINLDGGGSTTLSAIYGGTEDFSLINSPSDKYLRKDATYIFFENTAKRTKKLSKLFVYPYQLDILSGSKGEVEVKGVDSGYYPVDAENVKFFVDGETSVDKNGNIHAKGDGIQILTAKKDNITTTAVINCVKEPDEIKIKNMSDNTFLKKITLKKGEKIDFDAYCYQNHNELTAQQGDYIWSVDKEIGTVSQNGVFEALKGGTGFLTVKAGETEKNFEITVKNPTDLCDIDENWAYNYIETLYNKKVITGEKLPDGKLYYKPFDYVTRTQMAVLLSKSLDLDVELYKDVELEFEDTQDIPEWALPYVRAVVGEKIINGSKVGDSIYFFPENNISRAEIFTTVGRILEVTPKTECPFSDRNDIPEWAVGYIDALYEKGMVNGYSDNSLKPLFNVTKAEISKILVKALFE